MMYEHTGMCPFIDKCEYHATVQKIETNINKSRREISSQIQNSGKMYDDEFKDIQRRYESINRTRKRCYESHGHCLRYWSLRKKSQDKIYDYTIPPRLIITE